MNSGERRGHPVIFSVRNRVRLVIVTTRAMNRQAQKALGDSTHDLLKLVLARLALHPVARPQHGVVRPGDQEADSRGPFAPGLQHIPGQLHPGKLVIGQVIVESLDHPVPVGPGVAPGLVVFKTVALTVARHVQPVSRPTFSVMRGGQQAVDQLPVGGRRRIPDEIIDHSRCRWQPEQVKVKAPGENGGRGRHSRRNPLLLQPATNKGVDGVGWIGAGADRWHRNLSNRLKRPPSRSRLTLPRTNRWNQHQDQK